MFKNFINLFRIPAHLEQQKIESDSAWHALQNSTNSTISEVALRMNLMNQKQCNDNMRLALEIKAEREKLLKQASLQ